MLCVYNVYVASITFCEKSLNWMKKKIIWRTSIPISSSFYLFCLFVNACVSSSCVLFTFSFVYNNRFQRPPARACNTYLRHVMRTSSFAFTSELNYFWSCLHTIVRWLTTSYDRRATSHDVVRRSELCSCDVAGRKILLEGISYDDVRCRTMGYCDDMRRRMIAIASYFVVYHRGPS